MGSAVKRAVALASRMRRRQLRATGRTATGTPRMVRPTTLMFMGRFGQLSQSSSGAAPLGFRSRTATADVQPQSTVTCPHSAVRLRTVTDEGFSVLSVRVWDAV